VNSEVVGLYRGADKSLARPTSRCILFDGENIYFDTSLVIYINSTNIPPIMIINRICETQSYVAVDFFPPVPVKDLSAPLIEGRGHDRIYIGGLRKPMKSFHVLNRTRDFPSTQRECNSLSVSSL
jgi:hypothetical protein